MEISMSDSKPKIEYPCSWEFKVIGTSENVVRQAAVNTFGQRDYELVFSHVSKTGKYHSFNITSNVADEVDRDSIFASLAGAEGIATVL